MVQCYYRNDANPSTIRSINSGVCMGSGSSAGFFSCCFPTDECLPSGMCRAPHTNTTSSSTYYTFYTALCTDQTLQDSVCQKNCNGLYRTGLRYNTTNNLWACCDMSNPSCSTSTNLTFQAPAPDVLLQTTRTIVDFIPTSTGSATSASSTASASTTGGPASSGSSTQSTTTSTSQPQQNSGSSLSTGAIVGISIAGTVVAIAIIAGIIFWLLKGRKRANRAGIASSGAAPESHPHKELHSTYTPAEKSGQHLVEAPTPYRYHNPRAEKYGTHLVEAPTPDQGNGTTMSSVRADRRGLHELT